jgi:hypothetical protein
MISLRSRGGEDRRLTNRVCLQRGAHVLWQALKCSESGQRDSPFEFIDGNRRSAKPRDDAFQRHNERAELEPLDLSAETCASPLLRQIQR